MAMMIVYLCMPYDKKNFIKRKRRTKKWSYISHAIAIVKHIQDKETHSFTSFTSKARSNPSVAVVGRGTGQTYRVDWLGWHQSSSQHREKSSSLIKKIFGMLFGMWCSHHAIETRLHEERKPQKKLQRDMKEVKKALYQNQTPSPPGFEERDSKPPTSFEQRYERYESLDPYLPFASYPSQSFDAPPLE
jgi:hypothetical protein